MSTKRPPCATGWAHGLHSMNGRRAAYVLKKFMAHAYAYIIPPKCFPPCQRHHAITLRSDTFPLPKDAPPRTPISQHQTPPSPPLSNLDDSLPTTP